MSPSEKHYATMHNPTIIAVVNEMFRYNTEAEAQAQIKVIERFFVTSRKQITRSKTPSVHLWVKGYELSEDDEKQGILGNFAVVSYRKRDSKFVLFAVKMHTDAKDHPERKTPKRDTPNMGHPIIRAATNQKRYETIEAAQAELARLQEQFPQVTILNPGKIYIIIYIGSRPARQRLVKHIIEIMPAEGGGYLLNLKENEKKVPPPRKRDTTPSVGKFTAQVSLGKHKKRK